MFKVSSPVMAGTITTKNMGIYLQSIKKSGIQRVFLAIDKYLFDHDNRVYTNPGEMKQILDFFRENGIETGVWVSGIGHGVGLSHENGESKVFPFVNLEGADRSKNPGSFCPMDENFIRIFCKGIKNIAEANPDIIMIDDDLRFNSRKNTYLACFCPKHLSMYYERIGEKIPRDDIAKHILTGGNNRYRTEYLKLMGETLLSFAKEVRKSVDSVNPKIRLGSCSCCDSWDFSGVTPIELAKAFAGGTKPFLRTIGAPYWKESIIEVIEDTRLQGAWCEGEGIEVFAEGDVYPRPRYKIPSKRLENFHMALLCNFSGDGILKYMFDYSFKPDYETGYVERHIKNKPVRDGVTEIFAEKKNVGVHAINVLSKNENYTLPDTFNQNNMNTLISGYRSNATAFFARNSIPTSYEKNEYPAFICGENAKYVTVSELENGAILDISAAKILSSRGIDTGLIECEDASFGGEYFPDNDETVYNIGKNGFKRIYVNERAYVKSFFVPGNSPASYIYENPQKIRFFVMAVDYAEFASAVSFSELVYESNYANNYHRQKQLVEAIEWIGGKKLPAACVKNPNLYMLTARGEKSMSVALLNDFADEIPSPEIALDKEYNRIKFVNCDGKLVKDKVYLSEIPPFGFSAFEVIL